MSCWNVSIGGEDATRRARCIASVEVLGVDLGWGGESAHVLSRTD
jgi:hypothetical protein